METNTKFYDIAFIGHYTKDTIVSSTGIRVVDGGAFNYGANVAAKMGSRKNSSQGNRCRSLYA